jgi:hypothetical protein
MENNNTTKVVFMGARRPDEGNGVKKCRVEDPARGGGDRNRTGVQTYSTKAFYMFILELLVGR